MKTFHQSVPVGVVLLGFNDHDRAILELLLNHHKTKRCQVMSEEEADICILDLDSHDGLYIMQQQIINHQGRPLIALSQENIDIDNICILSKPVHQDLFDVAIDFYVGELRKKNTTEKSNKQAGTRACEASATEGEISTLADRDELILKPESEQALACEGSEEVGSIPDDFNSIEGGCEVINGETEYLTHDDCGFSRTVDYMSDRSNIYYDPSKLLQDVLKKAIDQCRKELRPVRMHMPDSKYITLLPKANIALTDLCDTKLRPRCLLETTLTNNAIDYPSVTETNLLRSCSDLPQDIDVLLWKVSLWSSRGRLPIGFDMDDIIKLRTWPNLTRMLSMQQFLPIATLWVNRPSSLRDTVKVLSVDPHYVYVFFSACNALGLINILNTPDREDETRDYLTPPPMIGNYLRRMLQRFSL